MVFYRKYRPQTIGDLDSTHVRETLSNLLKKDALAHAFLFTGPKGLGKTSTARIIAKIVNCTSQNRNGFEPCNICDECTSITQGSNLDVLELDAASNRGIDEIRDLKEKIRLTPVGAKMKVYIIDEVHMLTTEAFNALLKTLEEPPAHAMFILCTTEPHKVPATIVSRCLHVTFLVASTDEIVHSLRRITKSEQIAIDDDALYEIALLADGGFRDAAKILEEVTLMGSGQKITREAIEKIFKTANISHLVSDLFLFLKTKDTKKGLSVCRTLVSQGIDMKFFLQNCLSSLDQKLLEHYGFEKKATNTPQLSIDEITELSVLFSQVYMDTKNAILPQLPLEILVVEYTGFQATAQIEHSPNTPLNKAENSQDKTLANFRKQVGTLTKMNALNQDPPKPKVQREVSTAVMSILDTSTTEVTPEWQDALWKNIIVEMKTHNQMVAGVLRSCAIKSYDKKVLIIQAASKFHKDRIEANENRTALLKIVKVLTGNDAIIQVELKS